MTNKKIDMKCKRCGISQTYIRIKTNERVCRVCGYIEKLDDKKSEKKLR